MTAASLSITFRRFARLMSASNKIRSAAAFVPFSHRDVEPPVDLFDKRPHPLNLWPFGPAHVVRHPDDNLLDTVFRGKLQNAVDVLFRRPARQGFNTLGRETQFVAECDPDSFRSDVQAKNTQENPPHGRFGVIIDPSLGGTGVINYRVTVKAPVLG
jgi:hypothetical protein